MGQILIRQIDDDTLARLKARAKANDRSTEAEARVLLRQSLEANDAPETPLRPLSSFIGAGRSSTSFKTTEEIVAHVRALREDRDD